MKILVCVKLVPDTETKLKLLTDGSGIDTAGIKWVINPYDEIAVEAGLKLKEKSSGTVTVIGIGPKSRVVDGLRTALAMGADDAVCVDAPNEIESSLVAQSISKYAQKSGPFDVIFAGKLAIDDNQACVPQMTAGFLDIPHVSVVSKFEWADGQMTIERDGDNGAKETFSAEGPLVVSVNKGLNMPRYASLPGIMKAKKKVIEEISLDSLGIDMNQTLVSYSNYRLPPANSTVQIMSGELNQQVQQLVSKLRDEAKVL